MSTMETLDQPDSDTSLPDAPSADAVSLHNTDGLHWWSRSEKHFFDRKLNLLKENVERDPYAADFKWSLFVAACQNYRYDSLLKPYPPFFMKNESKDIDKLRETVDSTPSISLLMYNMQDSDSLKLTPGSIDLLYWVLVQQDIQLQSVSRNKFKDVFKLLKSEASVQYPNYIFDVTYGSRYASASKWHERVKGKKLLYACHGSRLENFYSIIHHGLQQHMSKNSLFGKGIYLSSELTVSLPYSPMGFGWGRSILGSHLSCLALCEMIDHPDVKCQDEDSEHSQSFASDSMGGVVPPKYYVVQNSDVVRVRYLLVYSNFRANNRYERRRGLIGWIGNHKLLTFIIGYIVMLAAVGLSNSPSVQRLCKTFLQKGVS